VPSATSMSKSETFWYDWRKKSQKASSIERPFRMCECAANLSY
jgi:hypothetical protein